MPLVGLQSVTLAFPGHNLLLFEKHFHSDLISQTISMVLSILYFNGLFLSLQTVQTLMKCHLVWRFIWVFTVCKSTCLPVSRMKRDIMNLYSKCIKMV